MAFGLDVGEREFNLSVNSRNRVSVSLRWQSQLRLPSRPNEGRVKGFYPVGGHDDFNIAKSVETIQLGERSEATLELKVRV